LFMAACAAINKPANKENQPKLVLTIQIITYPIIKITINT
jgi:hypothetical protein